MWVCAYNAERLCPIQICFKKPTKASTIFGQIILSSGKGQNLKMRFWLERSLFLNNRFFGPSNGFYFTNALKNYALSRRQIRLKGLESRIRKMQKGRQVKLVDLRAHCLHDYPLWHGIDQGAGRFVGERCERRSNNSLVRA